MTGPRTPGKRTPGLHLYVHFPFCRARCPYCAFYFVVGRAEARRPYGDAVLAELDRVVKDPRFAGRPLRSVYFGGGTPSLLEPAFLAAVLERARDRAGLVPDAEVSLEANPDGLDDERLAGLRAAGVTRLTLGWQSLREEPLRALGRTHTVREATESLADARRAGFDNIGVDLMFGLAGQTVAQWREDLRRVAELGPDHVSAYELTLEEGTRFTRQHADGRLRLPDEDARAEMFESVDEELAPAGIVRYEISNFARPGFECRHNRSGWRGDDLLGLGASAASHVANARWTNVADLDVYRQRVESGRSPAEAPDVLDDVTWAAEDLYLGLRTVEGTVVDDRLEAVGADDRARLRGAIDRARASGLLEDADGRVRLTRRGRLLADTVFDDLLSVGGAAG
ncbi:MAG: radical SAM family heme chaperone HemW [Gemmatimonadetes bacterium]|nr:radical SAM family heme chaperone HemW [Gemmatimonadota bacterium]